MLTDYIPVAVHIATGQFVHYAGPFTNIHDSRIFQEGELPKKFPPQDPNDPNSPSPLAGLADRGYWSTNPKCKLFQCLLAVMKKPVRGALSKEDKKRNQLLSTLRIEVERGIGRLRTLQRLVMGYRSSKASLADKITSHGKLFKICIHFTNYSIKVRPLRKYPHWLLCMGPIPTADVKLLLRRFLAADHKIAVSELLTAEHRLYYEEFAEEDSSSEEDTE